MLALFFLSFAYCLEPVKSVSFPDLPIKEIEPRHSPTFSKAYKITQKQKASTRTVLNISSMTLDQEFAISSITLGQFFFVMDTEMSLKTQTKLFELIQNIYLNLRGYTGVLRELRRLHRIKAEHTAMSTIEDKELEELFEEASNEAHAHFLPYQDRFEEHTNDLESQKQQYRHNYFESIKSLQEYLNRFKTPISHSKKEHLPSNIDLLDDY